MKIHLESNVASHSGACRGSHLQMIRCIDSKELVGAV